MGYRECLEAAGAKIIEYKEVGSYQGSWGAVVEYNGQKSLITGSYGSCSGCDSYEATFGCGYGYGSPTESNGKYYRTDATYDDDNICSLDEFNLLKEAYRKRMSDFAQSYLTTPMYKVDIEQKLKSFNPDDWFDSEEKELYEWAITFFQ